MKQILKNKAWDIDVYKDSYICCFNRSLQKISMDSLKREKTLKMREEYYTNIHVYEKDKIIIAYSLRENCLDILDAATLELIHSMKWKGERGYLRGESKESFYYDAEEKVIYDVLYSERCYTTCISKIDLKENEEEIILKIPEFYSGDIFYDEKRKDFLVVGNHFLCRKPFKSRQEGIWLRNPDERVLFTELDQRGLCLNKLVFTEKGNILYMDDFNDNYLFLHGKKEPLEKNMLAGAFSKNKKWIAIMKKKERKTYVYIYSMETRECIGEIEVNVKDWYIKQLEFVGDDRYLCYRDKDDMYLFEI